MKSRLINEKRYIMKYDHAVKYKGLFYPTGAEVPLTAEEETQETIRLSDVEKERAEFIEMANSKSSIYTGATNIERI